MGLALLETVQQVCGELGLTPPATVIGSANNQTRQMLALITRLGKDLVREYEWQRLVREYVFRTTASLNYTGDVFLDSTTISSIASTSSILAGDVVTATTFSALLPLTEVVGVVSSTQVTVNLPGLDTGSTALIFKRQDYDLPGDYDRMISDTQWDRTDNWKNLGPESSQGWQGWLSSLFAGGPRFRFRIYRNKVRLFPAPTAAYTISYEYVSNAWVQNEIANFVPSLDAYLSDNDTCVFPDDLMLAGLKYYFLKAKKLDYAMEQAEYAEILSVRKAQDVPIGTKSLAPSHVDELGPTVPESNWNL